MENQPKPNDQDGTAKRPPSTRVDEKIAKTMEIIQSSDAYNAVSDAMDKVLDDLQRDNSSQARSHKVMLRLSLEILNKVTPTIATNAEAIAPIRNMKYACSRQRRQEKQEKKMLEDISNSLGRGARKTSSESSLIQKLESIAHGPKKKQSNKSNLK